MIYHMHKVLVAPPGLFMIEDSEVDLLGLVNTYGCLAATPMVYQALGPCEHRMGPMCSPSQVANHLS